MGKIKTGIKGFIFLLLIALIIVGVVLAIILWPQRPEKIKFTLNEQTSIVLNKDKDFLKNLNTFGEYTISARSSNSKLDREYNNTIKIYEMLTTYFDFVAYTFNDADFSNYERNDIQTAQRGFNSAKDTANRISNFLKEKNDALPFDAHNTKTYLNADAELVWQSVTKDFKVSFENYAKATEALAKVYRKNIYKGVYANDFAYYVVDGVGYYMSYFVRNYENLDSDSCYAMRQNFVNFVEKYISPNGGQRMVASYLTSTSLQSIAKVLDTASTYENYALSKLIYDNFEYADTLTAEQKATLNSCITFYKGGISK